MMTNEEFRDLVGQMRLEQKRFFKTRDSSSLLAAKELERQIDMELGGNTPTQRMFNDDYPKK